MGTEIFMMRKLMCVCGELLEWKMYAGKIAPTDRHSNPVNYIFRENSQKTEVQNLLSSVNICL